MAESTKKAKRQRLDLSQSETTIFMDIVKNSEGGKLFATVMSGTTTNEMKFKVWQMSPISSGIVQGRI